jgi:hypothetical protein
MKFVAVLPFDLDASNDPTLILIKYNEFMPLCVLTVACRDVGKIVIVL